ncbi:MAG: class I mannose-6-phosphate isomerase [Acetatifactor sp.]|nr:class I mannose-6-phosphate isomerase [Acetatifactor sp.]
MTNKNLRSDLPFILEPACKDYLWGGDRLIKEFGKNTESLPLAESWECSTHRDGESLVKTGYFKGMSLRDVLKNNPGFLGEAYFKLIGIGDYEGDLPILVKLIDAKEKLSLQVHPDDDYAFENEDKQLGKAEMWYVLKAEKDSEILVGFNRKISATEFENALKKSDINKFMNRVSVKEDDVYYIPPGTVHAIGAGVLIAEIQENSNLTYRLYDYDRLDKSGNKRPLNIKKAMEVIRFDESVTTRQPLRVLKYEKGCARELLNRCKYFEVYRILLNSDSGVKYETDTISYRVLLCYDGCGTIKNDTEEFSLDFKKGDCVFFAASKMDFTIAGQASFLDVRG